MSAGVMPAARDVRGALAVSDAAATECDTIDRLPPRPARTPAQQAEAEAAHDVARRARRRFMDTHADAVYDELTGGGEDRLRLADLVERAGTTYPGLVPAPGRMAAERAVPQGEKEGWEIDLGLFFAGILRRRRAGGHLVDSMLAPTPRAWRLLAAFRASDAIDLGKVRVRKQAGIAHLTVHNEEFLNAEDDQLADDFETAADLALLDEGVRACVVRGAVMTHARYAGRRVFSAGINLMHLVSGQISFVDFLLRRELGYVHKIVRGLRLPDGTEVEKPWIAAVDTFAIGGGMQLVLAFDWVVTGADAYFSLPAVDEGIVPGVANLRLPRAVGGRVARQVILGGRRVHATDAVASFLCDEVVEPEHVGEEAARAADRLATSAVVANRRMLRLGEETADGFRRYMAEFAAVQSERLYARDVIANVEAAWAARAAARARAS